MSDRDNDLADELESHLRMAIDDRVARGESRADAERAARREFGNVTHIKEVTREVSRAVWFERLVQDVRYGLRALRRTPAFTAVAVLTLAIGIGANSAVFSVVNSVLLRPLPFADPGRLFVPSYIPTTLPFEMPPGLDDRLYLEYRQRTRIFSPVAAYQRAELTLSGQGDATRLRAARVGADFLATLGVRPAIGRGFAREEEQPGREGVAILGAPLWRERFGADEHIVGKAVTLDGTPYTVIGVMPAGFAFPGRTEIWTPLAIRLNKGNSFIFPVIGRLKDGATPQQALSELESIVRAMPPDPRDRPRHIVARIIPLKDLLTARIETSLLLFAGAVAFVLLIACANVANLLLMRAATRRSEIAMRIALGASRTRIVRQLLTESTLVAVLGGVLGIVVSVLGVRALLAMAPVDRIPRIDEIHVDLRVLGFTLGVSFLTGLVFGLVPAFQSSRREPREALGQGARTVVGTHARLRGVFVVAEIALALVLLAGAGLMVKSFLRMRAVDTGFRPGNVVTMTVDLPRAAYPDAERVQGFHTTLLERIARIPGVSSSGAVSWRPMAGMGIMGDFHVEGATPLPNGYSVDKPTVSVGYFRAMGIGLVGGRDFTTGDAAGAPGVAIVSESVARKVWPNQDAVGKRITMSDHPGPEDWLTVVGVVNDVVQDGELTRHSTIYLPYLQVRALFFIDHMTYVARAATATGGVARGMRDALRVSDPAVPAQALNTMGESMSELVAEPLFQTRLLVIFSLIALLLSAIGTYGVLAYDVAERTHEIGLRMALGATPADVMRVVLGRASLLAVPGVLLGLAGALALTGALTKWLFEVKPNDPMTLVMVAGAIVVVALAAGYLPARRATRVDPLTALASD